MRKKSFILCLSATLLLGGSLMVSCGENNTETPKDEKLEFENASYNVNSGDKITVKGGVSGVTYSFVGGTPSGVTLNATTGEITFDQEGASISDAKYVASKGDLSATTTIHFVMIEEAPVVTITNLSDYLISGDTVSATAISDKGTEFAIAYSLKSPVDGVDIDAQTGKVTFTATLTNKTKFTVVATSKSVTKEKEFTALVSGFVVSKTDVQLVELNGHDAAKFELDFNGDSAAETESESIVSIAYKGKVLSGSDKEGFAYDKATKTVTLSADFISRLEAGNPDLKIITARNTVKINLTIADKFIYTADQLVSSFEPKLDGTVPSFKEGSLGGYYVLASDIDLSEYLAAEKWIPIGAYGEDDAGVVVTNKPFAGTFDGNGYTISGYSLVGGFTTGFFGFSTGTIKNFTLKGEASPSSWSGGIVGRNEGTVENVIADLDFDGADGKVTCAAIVSNNFGNVFNCLSINPDVNVDDSNATAWKKGGIIVGLNNEGAKVKNCYGINAKVGGEFKNKLIGSDASGDDASLEGQLFETVEDMKAFDFSSTLGTNSNFNVTSGALPTLKNLADPLSPGYIKLTSDKYVAIKGEKVNLNTKIYASKYEASFGSTVTYNLKGVEGATISGNEIDLTAITLSGGSATLTVEASLVVNDKCTLTSTIEIEIYDAVTAVEITNTETSFAAGGAYKLTSALTPAETPAKVSYTIDAANTGWKKVYAHIENDILTIDDDAPTMDLYIIAESLGISSTSKSFGVTTLKTVANNNVIHYSGQETNDFEYDFGSADLSGAKVMIGDTELESTGFSIAGSKLTVKATSITNADTRNRIKVVLTNGDNYRLFATKSAEEETTMSKLENDFGAANLIKINSVADFKTYFDITGSVDDAKVANLANDKVYVLTADLDFTAETNMRAIGYKLSSAIDPDSGTPGTLVPFAGKFYGLGHTISNCNLSGPAAWVYGFFAQIDGTVQDVNFDNINVTLVGGSMDGVVCGILGGEATMKNVNVTNGTLSVAEANPTTQDGISIAYLAGKSWSTPIYSTYNGLDVKLNKDSSGVLH